MRLLFVAPTTKARPKYGPSLSASTRNIEALSTTCIRPIRARPPLPTAARQQKTIMERRNEPPRGILVSVRKESFIQLGINQN